jgi:hypothetical protein
MARYAISLSAPDSNIFPLLIESVSQFLSGGKPFISCFPRTWSVAGVPAAGGL